MTQPTKYAGTYPSSWAGYRFKDPLGYTPGVHTGVDYNGPGPGDSDLGQNVVSIAEGVVVYTGDKSDIGFGKTVIIEHPFGVKGGKKSYSRYMHLHSIPVRKGQKVKEGQKIGTLGKTGTKYAHLHLDLWDNRYGLGAHLQYHKNTNLASYVDPFIFIKNNPAGQGEDMPTKAEIEDMIGLLGKKPTAKQYSHYLKNPTIKLAKDVGNTLYKDNRRLKAELANSDEANILGRALIPVLSKIGYKKQ